MQMHEFTGKNVDLFRDQYNRHPYINDFIKSSLKKSVICDSREASATLGNNSVGGVVYD